MDIDWDETFEVGVEIIDRQHRELLARLAALAEAMRGSSRQRIEVAINLVFKIVVGHLETEETLMDSLRYPDARAHAREHAQMLAAFRALYERLALEGPTAELASELGLQVNGWLNDHVQQTDKAFGDFLRAQSTRKTGT